MSLPSQSIQEAPHLYFKNLHAHRHEIIPQKHLFLANVDADKMESVKELVERICGEVMKHGSLEQLPSQEEGSASGDKQQTIERIIPIHIRKCVYITFTSTKFSIPVFEHLTQNKSQHKIHVQYAKQKSKSHFLYGLDNLISAKNRERIESIPGLKFYEEFISPEEEQLISQAIYEIPHHNKLFSEGIGRDIKRKVWHFGYEFKYSNNSAGRPSIPLPACAQFVVGRLVGLGLKEGFITKDQHFKHATGDFRGEKNELHPDAEYRDIPNQCTVNEYQVGEGISPHIDNAEYFSGWIASLSMLSESVMRFKDPETKKSIEIILPRRSLIVLTGESRYQLTHSIPQRQHDAIDGQIVRRELRLSITFRHAYSLGTSCALLSHDEELDRVKKSIFL